jgi:hypothetical protein
MADRIEVMDQTTDADVYEVAYDNVQAQPESQYETRESRIFRDQHGRRWAVRVEKRSGQPVGRWSPLDWSASLMPEGEYLTITPRDDGTNAVNIGYERWIEVLEQAHREYDQRERQMLMARFEDDWHKYRTNVPEDIKQVLGPRPPAVEPVVAAMQGNPWVLGLSTRVDLRLVKYLEPDVVAAPVSKYGDFSTLPEEAEEAADPQALGGKTIPVRRTKRPADTTADAE